MQRKALKYLAIGFVIIVISYNSVYFKKLSRVKAAAVTELFNASEYVQIFWNRQLIPGLKKAIELNHLIALLEKDKENTLQLHSRSLGIGNIRYVLVKGQGMVSAIDENDISVIDNSNSTGSAIKIATEFIYGNEVRDALGIINVNAFNNTMDLNNISKEINKKIRTEIIPPFKAKVQKGQIIQFIGAIELNQRYLNLNEIEVIPIVLNH